MNERHAIIIKGEKTRAQVARELGISVPGLYVHLKRRGMKVPPGPLKKEAQRLIYNGLGAEALEESEYIEMMKKSRWPYA